jgi:uncharacterized membrane protein YgdD (TMEM256/DUF423 family)
MATWLGVGALSGLFAVAAGAFGAHGLKARLTPELLAIFETAARYQMMHALLLVVIGGLALKSPVSSSLLSAAGGLATVGTVLFSGSLYVLALTGVRWLGAITPLGGLCFLGAWGALAIYALKWTGQQA